MLTSLLLSPQVLYRIEMAEQRQLGRGMLNRGGMNFDSIATAAQEQVRNAMIVLSKLGCDGLPSSAVLPAVRNVVPLLVALRVQNVRSLSLGSKSRLWVTSPGDNQDSDD
jgi:hypothetical protein